MGIRIARSGDTLVAEMGFFALLLGMAFIAGVLDSGVHRMLNEIELLHSWSPVVCAISMIGVAASSGEWYCGREWLPTKRKSVYFIRMWCSLFAVVQWAVLIAVVYYNSEVQKATFPLVLGPVCIFFHGWFAFVTRREGILVDPAKNTNLYEAKIDRRQIPT